MQAFYAPALDAAIASQRGGVLLNLQHSNDPAQQPMPGVNHAEFFPNAQGPLDWPIAWESYRTLVSDAGLRPFETCAR